ncbi:hypothetical protein RHGRI_033209 [Rhododendron griersonianum]|uniref:histidine kinase n=1 Tax=Rhododendron griersonianum TaxID=479676 RepID=A0AAV6HWB6_9ERIC|nr:hypothetical protein RHGRI_033209 [Rhododendron griersonianum]
MFLNQNPTKATLATVSNNDVYWHPCTLLLRCLWYIFHATVNRIAKVEDDYYEMMELKKRAEAADAAKSQIGAGSWGGFRTSSPDEPASPQSSLASDLINLIVSVEDTGGGIPLEARPRFFTPFMQDGGTGIGLSISKFLVGLTNGAIGFSSVHKIASTFSFTALYEAKRVFVFSDMEFDQASARPWETDYQVIVRKFGEKGYGSCVPEIVFWNLRDSKGDSGAWEPERSGPSERVFEEFDDCSWRRMGL